MNDLKFACRQLRRNPGFATVAVLTMALGIGAVTAIFSVVNGVLLRPMAFPHVDRLVMVWEGTGRRLEDLRPIWLLRFLDWQRQAKTLERTAFFESGWHSTLTGADAAAQVVGAQISPGFFSVLGVQPALGRPFAAEEAKDGGPPVIIISYGLWQRSFAGDPAVVGKRLTLDGKSRTIVGVMPKGFRFRQSVDFWMPFPMDADSLAPDWVAGVVYCSLI